MDDLFGPRQSVPILRKAGLHPTDQIGAIAEAATILRLHRIGLIPYAPLRGGARIDLLALHPDTGQVWKLQIKTAAFDKGKPLFTTPQPPRSI